MRTAILITMLAALLIVSWLVIHDVTSRQEGEKAVIGAIDKAKKAGEKVTQAARDTGKKLEEKLRE